MANTLQASFANLNFVFHSVKNPNEKVTESDIEIAQKLVISNDTPSLDQEREAKEYADEEQFPDEYEEVYRKEDKRIKQEIIDESILIQKQRNLCRIRTHFDI